MNTFPIVKRKDIAATEVKDADGSIIKEGTYRTKATILEIYDDAQRSIATGQPYETRMNPTTGRSGSVRINR